MPLVWIDGLLKSEELDSRDKRIQSLIEKNIKLEEELEEKSQELLDVKQQLKAIKTAVGSAQIEE